MADTKPLCKYGTQCYRKNPVHLAEYRHPHADSATTADVVHQPATNNQSPPTSDASNVSINHHQSPAPVAAAAAAVRRTHADDALAAEFDEPGCKKPTPTHKEQQCFDSDTDLAQRVEYERLITDRPAFILEKFLVSMPLDFYRFWDFCGALNAADPCAALARFNLSLVGPFDVMAGRFDRQTPREPADYLRHWRFFYDPPELQTMLVSTGKRDGLHYGYWRDDPTDVDKVLVARTDVDAGCEVQLVAENLFAALLHHLDAEKAKMTPFEVTHADGLRARVQRFTAQHGIALGGVSARLRRRNLDVVARTFHTAGLVVPINRQSDVGYRPLLETPAVLRRMLARLDDPEDGDSDNVVELVMERVQPLVTAANIAVDESDFGTAIELGVDLFCHGSRRLHGLAMQLLATGYGMVKRPQLIAIVKAHLSKRERSKAVSIIA